MVYSQAQTCKVWNVPVQDALERRPSVPARLCQAPHVRLAGKFRGPLLGCGWARRGGRFRSDAQNGAQPGREKRWWWTVGLGSADGGTWSRLALGRLSCRKRRLLHGSLLVVSRKSAPHPARRDVHETAAWPAALGALLVRKLFRYRLRIGTGGRRTLGRQPGPIIPYAQAVQALGTYALLRYSNNPRNRLLSVRNGRHL